MSVASRDKLYVRPQDYVDLDELGTTTQSDQGSEFYVTLAGQSFQFTTEGGGGPGSALVEFGLLGSGDFPDCADHRGAHAYVFISELQGGEGLCVKSSERRWVLIQISGDQPSPEGSIRLDISYLKTS